MKILLASSSSGSRGGGELYLVYLGRALAARGHDVALWISEHPRMDELATTFARIGEVHRAAYTNTYDRPGRSLASWLDGASARRAAADWKRLAPDLVHINKQNLEDGLDLLHAADLGGFPSLATVHLTQSARYLKAQLAPLRDLVARRALSQFRGILVTVLEDRRRDLLELLGDSPRYRTVSNGVPLLDLSRQPEVRARQRAELGLHEEQLLVLAVGRMVAQKRPLMFLEHAANLVSARPGTRCLWIGDGPLSAEWDKWVLGRGLEEAIQRLPWQADVPSFLFAADLFLHVAAYEGLPLALLEAMSAALPCAVSENLCREMPFLDETTSIVVKTAPEWMEAVADPQRRDAAGRAARRLIEEQFSFEKMAAQYEALYIETLREWR